MLEQGNFALESYYFHSREATAILSAHEYIHFSIKMSMQYWRLFNNPSLTPWDDPEPPACLMSEETCYGGMHNIKCIRDARVGKTRLASEETYHSGRHKIKYAQGA